MTNLNVQFFFFHYHFQMLSKNHDAFFHSRLEKCDSIKKGFFRQKCYILNLFVHRFTSKFLDKRRNVLRLFVGTSIAFLRNQAQLIMDSTFQCTFLNEEVNEVLEFQNRYCKKTQIKNDEKRRLAICFYSKNLLNRTPNP